MWCQEYRRIFEANGDFPVRQHYSDVRTPAMLTLVEVDFHPMFSDPVYDLLVQAAN
jgi:hypothetical protein